MDDDQVATTAPKRWKYVDGNQIGESRAISDEEAKPQSVKDTVCELASNNYILLKISKCATMQFHMGRSSPSSPDIRSDGQMIPLVDNVKHFYVTIQSSLKWDQHIENITTKPSCSSVAESGRLSFPAPFRTIELEPECPVLY